MQSVARGLVVRHSWDGTGYKWVYMRFLIICGSWDVWIWWSQPTLPLSVWCASISVLLLACFSSRFHAWFLYLDSGWFAACGHRVGRLLVVSVEGGLATHFVCCAESLITGSPPLLSDLDILYWGRTPLIWFFGHIWLFAPWYRKSRGASCVKIA